MLISQLQEQTSSKTSKLDLTVVQGCFEGLNGYLQVKKLHSKLDRYAQPSDKPSLKTTGEQWIDQLKEDQPKLPTQLL